MDASEFNEKLKNSSIVDRANDKLKKDGWLPSSEVLDMVLDEFNIVKIKITDLFGETES